ncbi:MAG: hypothetical protein ACLP9L_04730 [Thermoguttaceae bacterium]
MNDSTNQDLSRLKQMLEEVTAADNSVARTRNAAEGVPCIGDVTAERDDAEIAFLREAWLAFGQLVRAADASLPAMPNVLPTEPNLATPIALQKPRRSRWHGPIAAVAVALLIAVAFGSWISRDGKHKNGSAGVLPANDGSGAASTNNSAISAAVVKHDQPNTEVAQPEKATNKQPKTGTAKTSTWDDPPETQITSVSQQISNVEQNWQHRVDDVDLVQYRIDEVADSLQNDTI